MPAARGLLRFKLSPTMTTIMETDVLDAVDGDPEDDYEPLRLAWDGDEAFEFEPDHLEMVRAAVNALSNACDEMGNDKDNFEGKLYRAGARGFANLYTKMRSAK